MNKIRLPELSWPMVPPIESRSATVTVVSGAIWEIGGNAVMGIAEGIRERKPENFVLVPMYSVFLGTLYGIATIGAVAMDSKALYNQAKSAAKSLRETVDHFTN